MRTDFKSDVFGAIGLGLFVLLSRIPFLSRNYGYDGDAWSVARAAREIAAGHLYSYSRPPGFPVQELGTALIWRLGPLATNGLTALFSALTAMFFFLTCRHLGLRRADAGLAAVALAFTPIIYVNSTVTLDYVWGLAFLVAGLFAACRGWGVWAGIAVGLAIGCRATSAIMILPLAMLLPGRRVVAAAAVALVVGALCYVPALLSYGTSFIRFADEVLSLGLRAQLLGYGATMGVWGPLGVAGLALALVSMPWSFRQANRKLVAACCVAILLGVLLFARLPVEYAYLIPVVPFAILLIVFASPARVSRVALALIILSPFVLHVERSGEMSVEGALLRDARLKREQLDSIERYAAIVKNLQPDILETGPEIDRFLAQEPSVPVVRSLTPAERIRRLDAGEVIYVLRKQGHVYSHGVYLRADEVEVTPASGMQEQMLLAQLAPRLSAQERLYAELAKVRLFMVGTETRVEDGRVLREMFGPTLVQMEGRTFLPLFTSKERAKLFAEDDSVVAPIHGSKLPSVLTGIAEIVLDPGTPHQCMVSLTDYQAYLTR